MLPLQHLSDASFLYHHPRFLKDQVLLETVEFPREWPEDLNASTLSFPFNSLLGPSAYPSQGIIPLSLGFRSCLPLLSLAKRLNSIVPETVIVSLMGSSVKGCPEKRGLKPRLREDQINPVPGQLRRTRGASDR